MPAINETIGRVEIKAGELMGQLTIQVKMTGIKTLRLRLWAGRQLIKLGARIIGCGVELTTEH